MPWEIIAVLAGFIAVAVLATWLADRWGGDE